MPLARSSAAATARTLADVWAGSPRAHLGTTVAGFPNLFLLLGPNTGLGHNSMVFMIESQIDLRHRRAARDARARRRDRRGPARGPGGLQRASSTPAWRARVWTTRLLELVPGRQRAQHDAVARLDVALPAADAPLRPGRARAVRRSHPDRRRWRRERTTAPLTGRRRARAGLGSARMTAMAEPELVEREGEVRALAALLEDALAGEGRFALIEGPAGIGKTRLLPSRPPARRGRGGAACCARAAASSSASSRSASCASSSSRGSPTPRGASARWPAPPRPARPVFDELEPAPSADGATPRSRRCTGSSGSRSTSPPTARWCSPSTTCTGATAVAALPGLPGAPARGPAGPGRRRRCGRPSPAPTRRC